MKTHAYLSVIKEICDWKHLTVDEIFTKLKKKFPKAGRSTVYRNVEEMAKDWTLTKITWVKEKALFELTKNNHIHLIDVDTLEIKDLPIDNIDIPEIPYNFNVEYLNVDVYWKFE